MKPSEVLRKAAARLSKPGAWTQGTCARDSEGTAVSESSVSAVCWCLAGALIVEHGLGVKGEDDYLDRAIFGKTEGEADYVKWNDADERSQSDVVEALLSAAQLAESEGN